MPIVEYEVRTFEQCYRCDACGIGDLKSKGSALLTHPPKYPHVCDNCGAHKTLDSLYPKLTHKRVRV